MFRRNLSPKLNLTLNRKYGHKMYRQNDESVSTVPAPYYF